MSKRRRQQRDQSRTAQPPLAMPWHLAAMLVTAFIVPNIGALTCGFVLDDLPLIADNVRLHSLARIPEIWQHGYWPDRTGLSLYRPVTQSVWTALWSLGGGSALPFHAANLVLGAAVVVLLFRAMLDRGLEVRTSFVAALLFALMPIHTEATTSVVGSAELLAAAFGLASLILVTRRRDLAAGFLFALAVFSKESAAALALVLWLVEPRPRGARWRLWLGLVAIVATAILARRLVASGPDFIPPIDNPASLLPLAQRIATALWVQCLYVAKIVAPVTLSADYSYKQIPLVMSLADPRAWIGIGFAIILGILLVRRNRFRDGAIWYAVTFLPASNVLFAIGTVMGERLAYLPSAGVALILACAGLGAYDVFAARMRTREMWLRWVRASAALILAATCVAYGMRTFTRNRDWRDGSTLYRALARSSPESAKTHYFLGALLASEGDDAGAIRAYDRAIAIYPAYSEACHNRGNALARLGRFDEAARSYENALRFDPGHAGAAANLAAIQRGERPRPPRKRL